MKAPTVTHRQCIICKTFEEAVHFPETGFDSNLCFSCACKLTLKVRRLRGDIRFLLNALYTQPYLKNSCLAKED
jgi:hypothetical protein